MNEIYNMEAAFDVGEIILTQLTNWRQRNVESQYSVICHYEIATEIINELVKNGVLIRNIHLSEYDVEFYDKEYIITVTIDNELFCEPLYQDEVIGYKFSDDDVYLLHQDVNSIVLQSICDTEQKEIHYFGYIWEDE